MCFSVAVIGGIVKPCVVTVVIVLTLSLSMHYDSLNLIYFSHSSDIDINLCGILQQFVLKCVSEELSVRVLKDQINKCVSRNRSENFR